jgi:hypothetical protein
MLQLKEWPILGLASVSVGGIAIPQSLSPRQPGWTLSPWNGVPPGRAQTLSLAGYAFCEGRSNVAIAYQAGYQVTNEAQLVEGGTAVASAVYGPWAADVGVTYANGAPLVRVRSAPSPGQYALDAEAGTYDFAAADDGATVLLSYGYVPSDLADACIELVAERYKYAQRIGEKTHSLGGNETVGFDTTRFTPLIVSLLQPYRSIAPL